MNKTTLLRALYDESAPEAEAIRCLANEIMRTPCRDGAILLGMIRWCFCAGEAADADAWDLLVVAGQALLAGRAEVRTDVVGSRALIGALARRMRQAEMLPVHV